ncbi:50S ribosomal protein L9 [Nitrolancea hollandica]|uniref:Large ribosomal subunit protein bL9 n=1 Tax=Nitrolancea hollandica Lb TaxID=1129897 RepID=I4ENB4_9BACT|nr:50S ribosomal protein L9 [Nitrolancea hollandica]CCF86177.1 50S ribosomal protein L9 [Nitrolancea hollandica Lb]
MKVVLLKDVPKVGNAGSIQSVSDGFARNYLIPQGLAEMATPGRIKDAEQRTQAEERRVEREERAQQSVADQINGLRIPIEARVGGQGRLYGSITAQDIAEALSNKIGTEIDRRKVLLEEPIRTVGEYQVTVHLVGKLRPTFTLVVTSPEGVPGAFGSVETTPAEEDVASSAQAGPGAEVTDEEAGVSREQLES